MMDISCDACGKRYRIDETRIKGVRAKIKCRVCENVMVVAKPPPESPGTASSSAAATDFLESDAAASAVSEPAPGPTSEPKIRIERPYAGAEEQKIGTDRDMAPFITGQKAGIGLFGKILIVMLIVGLLPFGVFWFIAFKETTARIRSDAELLMAQTAEGLGNRIDGWIESNVAILRTAARLPDITGMERQRQEPVLKAIQAEYPWMYLVFTVGLDGMNVARNDDVPLKDYSDRQYYRDIIAGRSLAWQSLIGKTSNQPALVLAVPIEADGRLVGVMAAAMTVEDISKQIAARKMGQSGYAFLIDEKGIVIAHPDKAYVTSRKKLDDHPLIQSFQQKGWTTLTAGFTDQQGKPHLGHVRKNPYGWILALQQEEREVFAGVDKLQMFALTLLACTALLVLALTWLSARAIVTPIMKLTDAAERMSLGEMNVTIDVTSKDEIGLLAQAVVRMQTSLRMAMDRLRKRR